MRMSREMKSKVKCSSDLKKFKIIIIIIITIITTTTQIMAVTILLKLSWSTAQNIYCNDFYGSR